MCNVFEHFRLAVTEAASDTIRIRPASSSLPKLSQVTLNANVNVLQIILYESINNYLQYLDTISNNHLL